MVQADKGHGTLQHLKAFFSSVSTEAKVRLQEFQDLENRGEVCSKDLPSVEGNLLRKYLKKVKATEADGMHPGRVRGERDTWCHCRITRINF